MADLRIWAVDPHVTVRTSDLKQMIFKERRNDPTRRRLVQRRPNMVQTEKRSKVL